MKITVELPSYFKIVNSDSWFMVIDDYSAVMVRDQSYNRDMLLYPTIEVVTIGFVSFVAKRGIIEITEEQFREVYSNVYLELEKLMN
jgi:hypothetical protein